MSDKEEADAFALEYYKSQLAYFRTYVVDVASADRARRQQVYGVWASAILNLIGLAVVALALVLR
jgi:hypothetical protein